MRGCPAQAASLLSAMALYSYVVRYDSGFAPNPFYGFCTLATCKPRIRERAQVGDWVLGTGSGDRTVRRAGRLVYAMRVTEALTWDEYAADPRFRKKQPFRRGSRKQSCGDNIYYRATPAAAWQQRDSFHSRVDGTVDARHVARDTGVDRVLVSDDYVYMGGEGPALPHALRDKAGRPLCKEGRGESKFTDAAVVSAFMAWIDDLGYRGCQGVPFEWLTLRQRYG